MYTCRNIQLVKLPQQATRNRGKSNTMKIKNHKQSDKINSDRLSFASTNASTFESEPIAKSNVIRLPLLRSNCVSKKGWYYK